MQWTDHRFNEHAEFLPMRTAEELPCLTVAGVAVFAYIDPKDGTVQVSVHLDNADEAITRGDDSVPVQVQVQGTTVYDSDTEE